MVAGPRAIQVWPETGRLLGILVQATRAQRVLEIGTLGGYSAIPLTRALPPDGRLISLELDDHHAQVARENLAAADVAGQADVWGGAALELLPALAEMLPMLVVMESSNAAQLGEPPARPMAGTVRKVHTS